jgi:hypothetical protein
MKPVIALILLFILLTAHTINAQGNSSNETVQYYPNNQSNNATGNETGFNWLMNMSQSMPAKLETRHYIYGGLAIIMMAQIITIALLLRCRNQRTFHLKPRLK